MWLVKEPADPSAGYPFNGVYHNVIMMCPEHAEVFANAGWTIDDIKQALHRRSRLPFRTAMVNKPMPLFEASHPELHHLLDDPDTDVSTSTRAPSASRCSWSAPSPAAASTSTAARCR